MTDVFTKDKRSQVMSCIRGKGNKDTEIALLSLFRAHRITGWRRHYPIYGNPDFVFPKQHIAIFVDGCFWHCCPLHYKEPATNNEFWRLKLAANIKRDQVVNTFLEKKGWQVIRIWEHELQGKNKEFLAIDLVGLLKK